MTTRKPAIRAAAEEYARDVEARFPGAKTEIILESFDGFDAWIRVQLPPALHERNDEVLDATVELNEHYDDRGIHLIATVAEVEEVGAHG
jgi:hypothetical protein